MTDNSEVAFISSIVRNDNLLKFLTTKTVITLDYNDDSEGEGDYQTFFGNQVAKYQKSHQTLRRIMSKSLYVMSNDKLAYCIVHDNEIPAGLTYGSRIVLSYKLLFLTPKYDIGKHRSLVELVFRFPVKMLVIDDGSYILMDENHVFEVEGMERRQLQTHPSHGHSYHVDIYRLVSTRDTNPVGDENYDARFRLRIKGKDEKDKIVLSKHIWKTQNTVGAARHGNEDDFDEFKSSMDRLTKYLTEDTLHKLYLLSANIKDLVVKILFKIHTHHIKTSHMIDQFSIKEAQRVDYTDLEDRVGEVATNISNDLDRYFSTSAPVTTTKFFLYNSCTAKHFENIKSGNYVMFDNFLTGYTSPDSVMNKVRSRSDEILLRFNILPRIPVLVLPEHTKLSRFHNLIVLPRNMVFIIEEIKALKLTSSERDAPPTFRKSFSLQFSRISSKGVPPSIKDVHHVIVENGDLPFVSRRPSDSEE